CGISPTKTIIIPQDSLDNGELIQTLPEFLDEVEQNEALYNNYATLSGNITLRREAGCGFGQEETDDQIADMLTFLERDLAVGSFGISYGSFYDPGTTKNAMIELAKTSRSSGGMAASHIRQMLINLRNVFWEYEGDNPCVQEFYDLINIILFKDSLIEAIDTCREADIPYIVSHLTDMAYNDSTHWALETIQAAIVEQSLPLAADIIGYDTFKNDLYALTRFGEIPVKLLMLLTGLEPGQFWLAENVYVDGQLYMEAYQTFENIDQIEYLVQAFSESRASAPPESDSYSVAVWCNIVDPESTMLALTYPFVFIGNDGSVSRNETSGEVDVQPRTYACFSRLLGHWSRTENAIPMKETLFKATIAPALWLGLDRKGRLQQGCDADITVFDPDTIIDRAKPELGKLDLPPEGIHYVIVNGKVVVENGELTGTTPGRLIRRTWSVPGNTQAVISLYQDKFPD
ncbi:MAG: amidohydrolase family protein, partial [Deltaproteobacteria bacterium]|nr:amidohydrolase family protein [Deltaproteobacteria bacterium]